MMNGPGGEKTQATGAVLEDVEFVDVEEVTLLEVVEATLDVVDATLEDDVVDDEELSLLEVVESVDVTAGPSNLRAMLTPRAITTTTRTAEAAAILPIPLREVLIINRENERRSIFKTYQGGSTFL